MYEYDKKCGRKCWVSDVKQVTENLHLPNPDANILYDMANVQVAIWNLSMDMWWKEAVEKRKLRTYVQLRSRQTKGTIVRSNVKRYHRSILCKLLSGILLLELGTGRFTNVKVEDRTCKVCNLNRIEDESHFLFSCPALQIERSSFHVDTIEDIGTFMLLSDTDKISLLLQPGYIKKISRYVENILRKRQFILYKPTV